MAVSSAGVPRWLRSSLALLFKRLDSIEILINSLPNKLPSRAGHGTAPRGPCLRLAELLPDAAQCRGRASRPGPAMHSFGWDVDAPEFFPLAERTKADEEKRGALTKEDCQWETLPSVATWLWIRPRHNNLRDPGFPPVCGQPKPLETAVADTSSRHDQLPLGPWKVLPSVGSWLLHRRFPLPGQTSPAAVGINKPTWTSGPLGTPPTDGAILELAGFAAARDYVGMATTVQKHPSLADTVQAVFPAILADAGRQIEPYERQLQQLVFDKKELIESLTAQHQAAGKFVEGRIDMRHQSASGMKCIETSISHVKRIEVQIKDLQKALCELRLRSAIMAELQQPIISGDLKLVRLLQSRIHALVR